MTEQAMKIIVGTGVAMVVIAAFVIAFRFSHLTPVMDEGESITQNPIQPLPEAEEGVMCTMDAKMCPDGSAVGRSGPNCEFAPCPDEGVSPMTSKAYTNAALGIRLAYDASFTVDEGMPEQVRFWKWGPTQRGQTELYDGAMVTFQKVNLNGSIDEYAALKLKEIENVGTVTAPLTTRVLGGRTAKTYSVSALGDFTVVLVPVDASSALEITTMAPDPTGVGFQSQVDALLLSVKFVSEVSAQ